MMKARPLTVSLLTFFLFTSSSFANEANVCRSESLPQLNKKSILSNETIFECGSSLSGTIPSLSKAGWKINSLMEQSDMPNLSSFQPGQTPQDTADLTKTYWMLIIQK